MKTLFFLLSLVPLLAAGQCDPASLGTLRAEVSGNLVTLFNDTAFRNCGAVYSMEITQLSDDTLKWFQRDLGGVAYCLCHFNLSVTVDSLSAGNYMAKAYFQELMSGNDCYIGSIPFTISEPGSYANPVVLDQEQSDCLIVGAPEEQVNPGAILKVFPNPARGILHMNTSLPGEKTIRITDIRGALFREYHSFEDDMTLYIGDLPHGMYMLTILTTKQILYNKFCKH